MNWKFLLCGCDSLQRTGSQRGPHGLRPLTVLLGIVAQLLIIGYSGIAQWSALLDLRDPLIECPLPVQGALSTLRSTSAPTAEAIGFVLARTSSWK